MHPARRSKPRVPKNCTSLDIVAQGLAFVLFALCRRIDVYIGHT